MARLLQIDRKTFLKQVNSPLEYNPPGRPSCLTDNEQEWFKAQLREFHQNMTFPTLFDLQAMIHENTTKIVSMRTIHRIIEESEEFTVVGAFLWNSIGQTLVKMT